MEYSDGRLGLSLAESCRVSLLSARAFANFRDEQ